MYRYQAIDKLYIIAMRRVINPAEIALSGLYAQAWPAAVLG